MNNYIPGCFKAPEYKHEGLVLRRGNKYFHGTINVFENGGKPVGYWSERTPEEEAEYQKQKYNEQWKATLEDMKREREMQKEMAKRNKKPDSRGVLDALKRQREIYEFIKFSKDDPEGFRYTGMILGVEPRPPIA